MPDKCKACPHHSMCADAKTENADSTKACCKEMKEMKECGEKKECCEKMKSGEKKEACCKEMKESCCKEKKECGEKKDCCEKKDSTKACKHIGECTKKCGKKSN
jgi:hypothetical protein